ncbi:hypothetical protein [Parasphingorhabdus cellanae]|uniref:Uncharacterized protein n=1 Tax=Parasphingorhabdus cellanae TaxID=2806553 RepID=A0ABX7T449_9SPHN|nr:hypothetical protein [Parasphingorhabdus cellanae]QTD55901.1 hypothetical protein J4G78_17235 [Parasphingorhabdus cellanae]
MVELVGPLLSMRDSLHNLLARVGSNYAQSDRVTRTIFKVNSLLQNFAEGTRADIDKLRVATEDIAQLNPIDTAAFDILFDAIEEVMADL